MPKIRVLIVDDSVVIRRLLTDALAGDPDIEVAGTAASGKIALAKITQVNPDVVTLDVEMPEMDGIQTLIQIRKTWTRLPVIMFSTLTERGASSTLDALTHGASDYVTKPANVGSVATAQQRIRDEMIPKIKALCTRHAPEPQPVPRPAAAPPSTASARSVAAQAVPRVGVLAIGVSTGGPNALAAFLPELPASLPVPVVIVQHMPPTFTKLLADRLASRCQLAVHEAAGGETLAPGGVWIAPGDHHMTVVRRGGSAHLALNQDPPENSCRPAVDVLFRSVAEVYRAQVLALVLTGMGQDGLIGCEWIKERHGRVFVQDEKTSVVWGMPGFVARAGLADRVLPLEQLAGEVVRAVGGRNDVPLGLHAAGAER